jgi:hypothetical protein
MAHIALLVLHSWMRVDAKTAMGDSQLDYLKLFENDVMIEKSLSLD